MVNWQEAGKTWPLPHPHAVRLLRGLVWGQHYRHSNPQCEGGIPGSFELREDMGPDRLQAVEDWLRVEGYAYRFRQKRWRICTRPDRPGEGLRPNGIEEDENPNEYPSRATINVSMWDMIEKKFPEPHAAGQQQQRVSSEGEAVRRGQEAGQEMAGVPGIPGRRSRPSRQGRNPSPQPPTGQWRSPPRPHHPWQLPRSRQAGQGQAPSAASEEVRPQQRRGVGPRGRMPADQASSSSSVAPDQRDVARTCKRACGVPCNLRVARQRATQQNAAVEGAVGIPQGEATDWGRGMAFHASTVAAIAAGLTAAAAQEAATARVRGEVAAAAQEARLAQEAIVLKEAEVKALEEALAQERAKKEAEERAHAEATAKAQADAARKDAIEAARRKVAEERAKTEADLAALEAEKARLQRAREAEAARAREEAERRAAAATAAAVEEAEAKLQRETPPGGSRVQTL